MAQCSSSGKNPVSSALRNELVLQQVFTFLPLKSLLACREVNHLWNAEAWRYIRDRRKCTAFISSPTILPCTQLEQLDQYVAGMAIVPFDSLKIKLRAHAEPGSENSRRSAPNANNSSYENLLSGLKLKNLWFSWDEFVPASCPANSLIFRILTEKAAELRTLGIEEMSSECVRLFSAVDRLEFPRLQELEIGDVNDWLDDEDKGLLQKIMDGAPNLKKINHDGDRRILEILPEHQFKLLSKFEFDCFNDEDLTRNLIENGPKLSHIVVTCIEQWDFPASCHPLFYPLVQKCSSFVKTLEILCPTALQKIRRIPHPIPNLTHLKLGFDPDHPFEFIREFQQLRFQQLFPKLEVVELNVGDAGIIGDFSQSDIDREFSAFVPDSRFSSLTTKKLCVTMEIKAGGLLELMKSFPCLEHLEISAGNRSSLALPYKDIFRFWPGLKTLVTNGYVLAEDMLEIENADAEFGGLYPEELELLGKMGLEDLEKLQMVPARPCVSTMKNLETFSVSFLLGSYNQDCHDDDDHDHGNWGSNPASRFLSPVTEILVLKRMPWLKFSLEFSYPTIHGIQCGGAMNDERQN